MALDVELLRSTFVLVVERNPNLTARFYDVLFEKYPQAKPLFNPANRKRQEQMLAGALSAVLDHLEDAPWLQTTLQALGAKHKDYGVTPEMYGWVGDSLLITLAETAGPDWTPTAKDAWAAAYGAIASMMLADG
ncbi:MAG TPA: globin domain-containing protein [Polyangiaceae bacterium]|jgi:hemoglobin-like flavoprotein|nr:globin domain-containing protein [Polyangiaceae bacterium]